MARYCPTCGKSDEKTAFHGEMCMECARTRVAPLPVARITVCAKCGEVMDKGRKKKNMTVQEEATRLLKLKECSPVYSEGDTKVEYDTPVGRLKQDVSILITKAQCADCSRSHSQYFEAIIQLRGNEKKVERMAGVLGSRIESRSFIPRIDELKEGIDIYCGSRNEAIAALNAQKLGFLRTEKLAGEKNGKRLYRTTLLVRL